MTAIVQLNNLSRHYRQGDVIVKAVDAVSLAIESGDFAAICGPSGSGKTSILNLIGGLDRPTAGEVWLEGINLAEQTATRLAHIRQDRIGFVFQAYNLIPVMSAFENAAFVLDLQGVEKAEKTRRVMEVLAAVGLQGLEHRRPDEMSGGQQQRVAIARAIVTRPAIVLADDGQCRFPYRRIVAGLDAEPEPGTGYYFSVFHP